MNTTVSNMTIRPFAVALLLASTPSLAGQPPTTPGISGWLPAAQIDAIEPALVTAVADRSGVHAVWTSYRGSASTSILECARYTWNADWIPCERFGEAPAVAMSTSRLVAAPNGDKALVWDRDSDLLWKRFTAATDTWSDSLPVDARVGVFRPKAGLQFDTRGTAHLAYTGSAAGIKGIFASHLDGLEWDVAELISTGSTTVEPASSFLVSLERGAAVATWLEQSSTTAAYTSRSFSGGVWRSPKVIPAGSFRFEATPVLASLGDRALFAYVDTGPRGETIRLLASTYDLATDRWNTPTVLHESNKIVGSMALCSDDQGAAMLIASIAGATGSADLVAFRYANGSWSASNPVLPSPTGARSFPKCAMAPSGSMLVTWLETVVETGSRTRDAWGIRYTPGEKGWRRAEPLSTSGVAGRPIVTLNDRSEGMALWTEHPNGVSQLWYRTFLP